MENQNHTTPHQQTAQAGWNLSQSYTGLPQVFHAPAAPTAVSQPKLLVLNEPLANFLGLDAAILTSPQGVSWLVGNTPPPGAQPIAQAYAGHQFGHFTTLGDGRAILLGEQHSPHDGQPWDVQLKGAGLTRYSRGGDGRAAVGPMLREYLISESMAALGIPTTRSLAVVATGEPVYRRETLPGAVLTRVAASHVRVGTFQWAALQGGGEAVRLLVDFVIPRHFPELTALAAPEQPLALLEAVVSRQAKLISQWLGVGFIHGVMNTDNMAISGETIDYGPCAFLDKYAEETVFSSIDQNARYAYGNQPRMAQWNLARFAECLLPILDPAGNEDRAVEKANQAIRSFAEQHTTAHTAEMCRKLGFQGPPEPQHTALVSTLLQGMEENGLDFTLTFAELSRHATRCPCAWPAAMQAWWRRWQERLQEEFSDPPSETELQARLQAANPVFIPRNHLVEAALQAASEENDLALFQKLLSKVQRPFDYSAEQDIYTQPDPAGGAGFQTFCGT